MRCTARSAATSRATSSLSLIAGTAATIVLFAVGSDYAIALGLVVAILDLVPLAGATIAAVVVSTVVLIETDWLRCLIVIAFLVGYQQFENHVLQPLVYGRTVQLSPLAVLCAVLIGAELAGILGALVAIPVAGSLLAVGREFLEYRRDAAATSSPPRRAPTKTPRERPGAGCDCRPPEAAPVLDGVVPVAIALTARTVVRPEPVTVGLVAGE